MIFSITANEEDQHCSQEEEEHAEMRKMKPIALQKEIEIHESDEIRKNAIMDRQAEVLQHYMGQTKYNSKCRLHRFKCDESSAKLCSWLMQDSLKSASSMENNLQYNAIYWETGHRTYLPMLAELTQKFSWKLIDDKVRDLLRLRQQPVMHEPFVFLGNRSTFRQYLGDPDLSIPISFKKRFNFCFAPTGTFDPFASEKKTNSMTGADVFNEIMRSAFIVDFKHYVQHQLVPEILKKRNCATT